MACALTGVKKIDSALYKDYKDTCFGIQRVTGLQVCAMLKPKATDGYYQLLHQVRFGELRVVCYQSNFQYINS